MNRGARVFAAGAALWAACGAMAQAPTTKVLDCTNAGCHAKEMDHKFLHGPTAVQACDMCHDYQDPAKHTFVMKRQGKDLCTFCHIDKAGTEAPVVHDPMAKGDCLACHDPHGAMSKPLLKKEPMSALCADCHKDVLKGSHVHSPAATDCTACHQPHTADHAKLLNKPARELCLSCHESVAKTVSTASHPHKPADGDCMQCHTPHASDQGKVLKLPVADLCISCHQEVGKTVAAASHPHSAVTDARACLNCHTAHGSEHAKQLTSDSVGTCLACHKQAIKVDEKRTVAPVTAIADPALHKHGPVADGNCAACHGVHGSPEAHLLLAAYTDDFYRPFSAPSYALCFKCHDQSLAMATIADSETKFRDGSRNLHYVHVAKGTQARSCRACHDVHASRAGAQIAETVSYGQWKLPINFKQTDTGGSCAPGCHKAEQYDRIKPVRPAAAGGPTAPSGPTGATGPTGTTGAPRAPPR
jgi:predicted CXXCH cytochrome family protein